MNDDLKILINDFFERDLSIIKSRELSLPDSPDRIITVTGARRVGKTSLILHHINKLRGSVNSNRLLYINFENDRLFPFTLEKAQQIIDTYYEMFPANKSSKVYFFFDEIQNIPEWPLFIRRLYDTEKCCIFLTGSSSRLLSREIATSLRGRTLSFELFPLSFREYLSWGNIDYTRQITSALKCRIIHTFDNYISASALPEAAFENDKAVRQSVLHEYLNMVVYSDLIERYNLTQHTLVRYFIKFLAVNISNPISINKLYNDFKSQGMQLSKNSLYDFFTWLEESYIFYNVGIYSTNLREQQRNPRKVYTVDIGLKLLMDFHADKGRLLENIIYLDLRRSQKEIYYTKGRQEVDFLYHEEAGTSLINVCYDQTSRETFNRELSGLFEAMDRYGISRAVLITAFDKHETIRGTSQKEVEIIPAWQWLLHLT